MKFIQLTWFHFKRITQSISLVAMTFIMPLFIISGLIFIQSSDSNNSLGEEVVVLNHSEFVEENVYPRLSENLQAGFTTDAVEVFDQLDQSEISMVYEIPAAFPQEGVSIKTHSINGENSDIFFEAEFMKVLSETLTDNALNEAGVNFESIQVAQPTVIKSYTPMDGRLAIIIFMVIFFASYSSSLISSDLNKLRSDGVLTRSIVTNSRSWQILGSILGAYTLYNLIASIMIVLIVCTLFGITISQVLLIVSSILAFSIFNVGLTMMIFRLFKNEQLIAIVGIVLTIILVFMGIGVLDNTLFEFAQYVSPFYWLFETIDTGVLIPNMLIVALYGLVLFTTGSFKVERLVRV